MSAQKYRKLNQLDKDLPEGLLVDAAWMERHGYYGSLRQKYLAAGRLEKPVRGVYRRPRGTISWEQVVISLQTLLGHPVSVGGYSALLIQGFAHYLPQAVPAIHLYSDEKLPGWIAKLDIGVRFTIHNRQRFLPKIAPGEDLITLSELIDQQDVILPGALRLTPWGHWKWPMVISTVERAILEMIDELPGHETFHHVDMIMESLVNLSPRRMQPLLEQTSSVKVKRLFFYFADRHQHRWLNGLDLSKIDLGKGKRVLVKGGKLDKKYQITVPEGLDATQR